MFCFAYRGLGAVGVFFKKVSKHTLPYFPAVTVHSHVFLFIHGLKFGMKKSHDRITEPLRFNGKPLAQFVRRNIVEIDGLFNPGVGIGAMSPDGVQKFVLLVWYGIAGGNI